MPRDYNLFSRAAGETPTLVKGQGVYIWDSDGKKYLDGSGGPLCVNIGYGVQEVNDSIKRQMDAVSFAYSGFFVAEAVKELSEKLAAFSPGRNWEQIRTTIAYNKVPVIVVGCMSQRKK